MDKQQNIAHAAMMRESSEWQYALRNSGHCISIICALEVHGMWGKRNKHKLSAPIAGVCDFSEVITAHSGETSNGYKVYTAIVKLKDERYLYFRTTTNKAQRQNKAAIAFTVKELIQSAMIDFKELKLDQIIMDY